MRERLIDKAHPDKVLSLIKRTNFHDPNSTLDLINYFIDVQGVLNAIPLGCSKDVTYKLYLDSPPTKLCVEYANSREEEERRSPDDPTTLAPPRYFCVVWHKFVVNEGKVSRTCETRMTTQAKLELCFTLYLTDKGIHLGHNLTNLGSETEAQGIR